MNRLVLLLAQAEGGSFWETKGDFLDQWELPVGAWGKEAVNWVTVNLEWLTNAIAAPFEFLLDLIINKVFFNIPWFVFVLVFLVVGWTIRGIRVGLMGGFGFMAAGLLGEGFWELMTQTIGMILVAVVVSCVVGIPVGIISARNDGIWNTVRPILDAMQVIPAFVYLIPVVFIWGTRQLPATIATMIFAFPPVVRLTNLGVRQVPSDVVEASRAFGASERRVLLDVQIPLARPAIMAGINQTLLLALSMVVIAAVIAGGGLGQRVLTGIGTTDIPLGVSAGFALYLVAVALDRVSQPAGTKNVGLWRRLMGVMAGRIPPAEVPAPSDQQKTAKPIFAPRPIGKRSQLIQGGALTAAGGVIAVIAVFLPWAHEGSLLSSYVDLDKANLAGQSFVGWQPEGGSFLGIFLGVAGLVAAMVGVAALLNRSTKPRSLLLSAESGLASALVAVVLALAYLWVNPASWTQNYAEGIGPLIALAGALIALLGSWVLATNRQVVALDDSPRPYLRIVAMIAAGLLLVGIGGFSSWVYDERRESAFSSQASQDEIAALRESDDPAVAAAQIAALAASENTRVKLTVTTGFVDNEPGEETPGLAWIALFAAAAALAASLFALLTASSPARARRQWLLDLTVLGFGLGVIAVTLAWVLLIMEMGDTRLVAGIGTLFTIAGGFLIAATAASGLNKVTDDWT